MRKQQWVVERIRDDGWSELRREIFVYVVPMDVLPDGTGEGDVLQTYGSKGDDYGRWETERQERAS